MISAAMANGCKIAVFGILLVLKEVITLPTNMNTNANNPSVEPFNTAINGTMPVMTKSERAITAPGKVPKALYNDFWYPTISSREVLYILQTAI